LIKSDNTHKSIISYFTLEKDFLLKFNF